MNKPAAADASPPISRREQLLQTATELFYRNGCHTTGIDRVLAEAGVAKMTLYKHFHSKDELVLAAAWQLHQKIHTAFESYIQTLEVPSRQRLLAIFDFMADWSDTPGFCGCPSVNLAVQYPDLADPIHQAAAEHKKIREAFIRALAASAGARNPDELARNLLMLLEGAMAMGQVTGDAGFIRQARQAAGSLIDLQFAQSTPGQ